MKRSHGHALKPLPRRDNLQRNAKFVRRKARMAAIYCAAVDIIKYDE